MRYFIVILTTMLLVACAGGGQSGVWPGDWEAFHKWNDVNLPLRKSGQMKRSVYFEKLFQLEANWDLGPYTAEYMKLTNILLGAARSLEAGKISKESHENIRRSVQISFKEIDTATGNFYNSRIRQINNEKRAAWARVLGEAGRQVNIINQQAHERSMGLMRSTNSPNYTCKDNYRGGFDCSPE